LREVQYVKDVFASGLAWRLAIWSERAESTGYCLWLNRPMAPSFQAWGMMKSMSQIFLALATILLQSHPSSELALGLGDHDTVLLIAREYWQAHSFPDPSLLERVTHERAIFCLVIHQPDRPARVIVRNKQEDMDEVQRQADLFAVLQQKGILKGLPPPGDDRFQAAADWFKIQSLDVAIDTAAVKMVIEKPGLVMNTFYLSLLNVDGQWKVVSSVAQFTQLYSSDHPSRSR